MARLTRKKASVLLAELTNENLREICDMYSCAKSGNKQVLIERILGEVNKVSELNTILEDYGVSTESDVNKKQEKKEEKKTKAEIEEEAAKLFKKLVNLLKKIEIPKVRNEHELELYMLGYLRGKFTKIPVNPQTIGVQKGKTHQPDITVGDNNDVAIELKYIQNKGQEREGVGQAYEYIGVSNYVILYYYYPHPDKKTKESESIAEKIELITYPK